MENGHSTSTWERTKQEGEWRNGKRQNVNRYDIRTNVISIKTTS